jgi:hypothetical protein
MAADNQGQAITEMLDAMKRFLIELAVLLQTADRLMAMGGWKPYSNKARAGSESIQMVSEWIPKCVFRYYTSDKRPETLAFVSVLLAPDQDSHKPSFEPVLSAGVYKCDKGQTVGWNYDMARWHICVPAWKGDGSVSRINPQKQWPDDLNGCTAMEMASFAVPLVDIKNDELLEARIVKPLLVELAA